MAAGSAHVLAHFRRRDGKGANALKGLWTILLAILSFSLSLARHLPGRSGVLTSVHAFADRLSDAPGVLHPADPSCSLHRRSLTLYAWRGFRR